MTKTELKTTNKRICDFYKNNPNIDFEAMNLLLLDFLDQLSQDLTKTLQNTVQQDILQSVKTLQTNFDTLSNVVETQTNHFVLKFNEINREFLSNMKLVVENSMNTSVDKLGVNIDKTTDIFVSKLMAFMPQNNDSLKKEFQTVMKVSQEHICELVKSQNPSKIEDFFKNFDKQIKNAQEPLLNFIKVNHEQIKGECNTIRDTATNTQNGQTKVFQELTDFLNKYKNSSSLKGQYSENMLEGILNKMYPMAAVVNTSTTKASGDFMLQRSGMKHIMIENKNYESNVSNDEVKKFLRDIREQNCNGLFLSQSSGIANKSNFYIEIHEGNVLLYIHNVDHDTEKIKTGIDIIDHLSSKLKDFYVNEHKGFTIEKEILDLINSEYQAFVAHKDSMSITLRDFHKKMLMQIEDIKLPELQTYLCGKYATTQTNSFVCNICNESFLKKNALASHMKKHKTK